MDSLRTRIADSILCGNCDIVFTRRNILILDCEFTRSVDFGINGSESVAVCIAYSVRIKSGLTLTVGYCNIDCKAGSRRPCVFFEVNCCCGNYRRFEVKYMSVRCNVGYIARLILEHYINNKLIFILCVFILENLNRVTLIPLGMSTYFRLCKSLVRNKVLGRYRVRTVIISVCYRGNRCVCLVDTEGDFVQDSVPELITDMDFTLRQSSILLKRSRILDACNREILRAVLICSIGISQEVRISFCVILIIDSDETAPLACRISGLADWISGRCGNFNSVTVCRLKIIPVIMLIAYKRCLYRLVLVVNRIEGLDDELLLATCNAEVIISLDRNTVGKLESVRNDIIFSDIVSEWTCKAAFVADLIEICCKRRKFRIICPVCLISRKRIILARRRTIIVLLKFGNNFYRLGCNWDCSNLTCLWNFWCTGDNNSVSVAIVNRNRRFFDNICRCFIRCIDSLYSSPIVFRRILNWSIANLPLIWLDTRYGFRGNRKRNAVTAVSHLIRLSKTCNRQWRCICSLDIDGRSLSVTGKIGSGNCYCIRTVRNIAVRNGKLTVRYSRLNNLITVAVRITYRILFDAGKRISKSYFCWQSRIIGPFAVLKSVKLSCNRRQYRILVDRECYNLRLRACLTDAYKTVNKSVAVITLGDTRLLVFTAGNRLMIIRAIISWIVETRFTESVRSISYRDYYIFICPSARIGSITGNGGYRKRRYVLVNRCHFKFNNSLKTFTGFSDRVILRADYVSAVFTDRECVRECDIGNILRLTVYDNFSNIRSIFGDGIDSDSLWTCYYVFINNLGIDYRRCCVKHNAVWWKIAYIAGNIFYSGVYDNFIFISLVDLCAVARCPVSYGCDVINRRVLDWILNLVNAREVICSGYVRFNILASEYLKFNMKFIKNVVPRRGINRYGTFRINLVLREGSRCLGNGNRAVILIGLISHISEIISLSAVVCSVRNGQIICPAVIRNIIRPTDLVSGRRFDMYAVGIEIFIILKQETVVPLIPILFFQRTYKGCLNTRIIIRNDKAWRYGFNSQIIVSVYIVARCVIRKSDIVGFIVRRDDIRARNDTGAPLELTFKSYFVSIFVERSACSEIIIVLPINTFVCTGVRHRREYLNDTLISTVAVWLLKRCYGYLPLIYRKSNFRAGLCNIAVNSMAYHYNSEAVAVIVTVARVRDNSRICNDICIIYSSRVLARECLAAYRCPGIRTAFALLPLIGNNTWDSLGGERNRGICVTVSRGNITRVGNDNTGFIGSHYMNNLSTDITRLVSRGYGNRIITARYSAVVNYETSVIVYCDSGINNIDIRRSAHRLTVAVIVASITAVWESYTVLDKSGDIIRYTADRNCRLRGRSPSTLGEVRRSRDYRRLMIVLDVILWSGRYVRYIARIILNEDIDYLVTLGIINDEGHILSCVLFPDVDCLKLFLCLRRIRDNVVDLRNSAVCGDGASLVRSGYRAGLRLFVEEIENIYCVNKLRPCVSFESCSTGRSGLIYVDRHFLCGNCGNACLACSFKYVFSGFTLIADGKRNCLVINDGDTGSFPCLAVIRGIRKRSCTAGLGSIFNRDYNILVCPLTAVAVIVNCSGNLEIGVLPVDVWNRDGSCYRRCSGSVGRAEYILAIGFSRVCRWSLIDRSIFILICGRIPNTNFKSRNAGLFIIEIWDNNCLGLWERCLILKCCGNGRRSLINLDINLRGSTDYSGFTYSANLDNTGCSCRVLCTGDIFPVITVLDLE